MDEDSENEFVHSFAKNNREVIRTGVSTYKGKNYVFIRAFAPGLDNELIPTHAGISLDIEKCGELVQGIKSLGEVMSPEKVVARIKKNNIQEIWIGTNIYKEIPLIYIRTYATYDGEELRPTPKGVSMRVELYPKLLEAAEKLEEAVAVLKKDSKNRLRSFGRINNIEI